MASICIEHLTFTYPLSSRPALRDLTLSAEEGEFLLLCGESGCGKTTLLRHLKTALTPHGTRSGEILLDGKPLTEISAREQAERIGFVLQQPEDQIVTDKVWHELAFGPENLGVAPEVLRRRVGEMASFFGIQEWFDRDTDALSGGQKQLLNLASVLVMQPEVLILDEPTARLDPIAAAEFLRAVERVNRELGVTVLLSEQRLELALGMADRAVVLHQGETAAWGTPREVARRLYETKSPFFAAMPAAVRIWGGLGAKGDCPMDVRGGKALLRQAPPKEMHFPVAEVSSDKPLLQLKDVWFRYEKNAPDVLRGMELTVQQGEILAILGGNGCGKTTALRLLAGTLRPQRGKITRQTQRVSMLPQEPTALFTRPSLRQELAEAEKPDELAALMELEDLLDRDPGDLSGGEQQRAAMAVLLARKPEVLLLDEPTKGMDAMFRRRFGKLLQRLAQSGLAIVLVSHDVEFCAEFAHRAGLLFDGQLLTEDDSRSFFTGNHFYTTATNRMARQWLPEALLCEEVIAACQNGDAPDSRQS